MGDSALFLRFLHFTVNKKTAAFRPNLFFLNKFINCKTFLALQIYKLCVTYCHKNDFVVILLFAMLINIFANFCTLI